MTATSAAPFTRSVTLPGALAVTIAEYGDPAAANGTGVLVLHGGSGPITVAGLAAALARDAYVIVPTHPGFDGTPRPEGFDEVADLASAYLDLLDVLGLSSVLVFGSSVGGWIAAEMAVRDNHRVIGRVVLANAAGIDAEPIAAGWWMMARMLGQLPLPPLPAGAAEIAPGVGVLSGEDGALVAVHGLATFAWDAGDEAGRRLAAVQLVRLRAASQGQVAEAFGVDPATIWRWDQALARGGVAGVVPARRGPKGASKLTPALAARITELDAAGQTLRQIAAATGVSTFTVRNALGRVRDRSQPSAARGDDAGRDSAPDQRDSQMAAAGEPLPVLPDPVPRDGERALARWGLLGEGADPVFAPGARYPLAGLLLVLPALEDTGLLDCARQVYGQLKNGYYGLAATLLTLVFLALAGELRAEGATRVPPGALGRVLGLDRAPEVKTIRRKLGELAVAGKAADLIMALARHHAAARPQTLGFLYVDGHARAYCGTRDVQKMHIARLKFPAPATEETWVTSQHGDPVFMVVAEPSDSLAGELRLLLPQLRQIVGEGRQVTVCFDRGGWSPALFADITGPGSACSPGARARPPTSRRTRSPPSPAPMTGAGSISTTWPTPRSR